MDKDLRKSLIPIAAVLFSFIVLAAMQYHWLGQVAGAESQRMYRNLNAGMTRFADDFDRDMARIYWFFATKGLDRGQGAVSDFQELLPDLSAEHSLEELIETVYLVEKQSGTLVLTLADGDNPPRNIPWPVRLEPVRLQLSEGPPGRKGDPGLLALNGLVSSVPALIIPELDGSASRANPRSRPLREMRWERCRILVFNSAFLEQTYLPALAARYLNSADHSDYEWCVYDAADPSHVFARSANFPLGMDPVSSDAVGELFRPLSPDLRAFREARGRAGAGVAGANDPAPKAPARGRGRHSAEAPRADSPGFGRGQWRLAVVHRAGSLEAAVRRARLGNLAIGTSIMVLLAIAIALVLRSALRARRLAHRQLEFVAGISHELLTPLAAIQSASQNLTDGLVKDQDKARQYGILIGREGDRLGALVNQALEFAGMQSGQVTYARDPVDLSLVIAEALAANQPSLDERHFTVKLDLAPDLPLVLGDARALRGCFQNLIANVVKYAAADPRLEIDAGSTPHSGSGPNGEVWVRIKDYGPGIEARDLAHIFEPFYRGQGLAASAVPGSGLGLYLVKHIVAAHGGKIGVEQPARGNPAWGNPARGNPARGNPARGNPARGNPAWGGSVFKVSFPALVRKPNEMSRRGER